MKLPAFAEPLFLAPGAKRWLTRSRLPRTNALFPKTDSVAPVRGFDPTRFSYSTDPDVLRMTEWLAVQATDKFPVDVRPDGFAGPTAVPGNFYNVLSVSGYGMDPLPLPLLDNAKFVKSLGLATSIRKEDVPYLTKLIELFFGAAAPAPLHIRKAASTGFPYFITDIQYKKLGLLKIVHNLPEFLSLMAGGGSELTDAYQRYHSVALFAINERQQPAGVSRKDGHFAAKPRNAPTAEEARSGDFDAKSLASFAVDIDGRVLQDHFAMRRRTVFGMSGLLNYLGTAFMGFHRAVYLDRFAFTYKTRGPQDKEERIRSYRYVVGSDVKSMDTTVPRWFFDFLIAELPKYWDERLVEMLRRMLHAPYVVPPPWRKTVESYNPFFGDSPFHPDSFTTNVGLPSGIFINPDSGKLWMTFVYIILYRDAGAIHSPDQIEPFLMGRLPGHALLDMSDDAAMLTDSEIVRDRLHAASSPYAVLVPETPVIFLGDVLTTSGGVRRAFPNPQTFVVNMFAREDSIDRKDPKQYAEGFIARYQLYSGTPIFRDLNQLTEEGFRRFLGYNPYLNARSAARRASFVTDIDAMVKENPNVLYYKVDPADVSPDVLDELVGTIPAEDLYPTLTKFLNPKGVSIA